MKLIYWLVAVPLLIAAPLFAISNLQWVTLTLWPLPESWALSAPVFAVALGGLFVGFIAGGLVAWFGGGRARARARAAERAVRRRDVEIEDLRRKAKEAERASARRKAAPPARGLPAPTDQAAGQ